MKERKNWIKAQKKRRRDPFVILSNSLSLSLTLSNSLSLSRERARLSSSCVECFVFFFSRGHTFFSILGFQFFVGDFLFFFSRESESGIVFMLKIPTER